MSMTQIMTSISAVLMARKGDLVQVAETYSTCHPLLTKLICAKEYALEPVGGSNVQVIDFIDIAKAKVIMLKTTKPIFVTLTFDPTAPIPPLPTPTVEAYVKELLYITSEVTAITLTNPNAGTPGTDDAMVTLSLIGD